MGPGYAGDAGGQESFSPLGCCQWPTIPRKRLRFPVRLSLANYLVSCDSVRVCGFAAATHLTGHLPVVNVLIATSEAVPFAKTGGLGDVCGALPVELARQGQRPAVIMPGYRQAYAAGPAIEP